MSPPLLHPTGMDPYSPAPNPHSRARLQLPSWLMSTWLLSPAPESSFDLTFFRQLSKTALPGSSPWPHCPGSGSCVPQASLSQTPLGCPAQGLHSPGLRLPLHQPPVPPPLGVGAEVVCQLPAQLLHGPQCVAFLQGQPQADQAGEAQASTPSCLLCWLKLGTLSRQRCLPTHLYSGFSFCELL